MTRKRVGRVEAARAAQHRSGIRGGEREDRHAVERSAGGHHAARAEQAARRLEADDVVERGRHASGARGVGAEAEADQSGGNRDRGAGARAAGQVARIEGIDRRAVRRTYPDQTRRELIEVGFADQQTAGGKQCVDHSGVRFGDVAEFGTGRGGRLTRDIDVVLDREGDPVERQVLRVAPLQLGRARLQLRCGRAAYPDLVVAALLEPLENSGDGLRRAQTASAITCAERGKIERIVGLQHATSIL